MDITQTIEKEVTCISYVSNTKFLLNALKVLNFLLKLIISITFLKCLANNGDRVKESLIVFLGPLLYCNFTMQNNN